MSNEGWVVDGKFFRVDGARVQARVVTYGPFPPSASRQLERDLAAIRSAGFHAIRVYEMPSRNFLDRAREAGLHVFAGLQWQQYGDFISRPSRLSAARVALAESLRKLCHHPALAGVYVANEIPADLVRWMGPTRVRDTLESLIELGKSLAPELLFAYANYPSTEFLEPANADFTAFNVFLEDESAFRAYLRRLHHIAGDRPLVISEFGLDSLRHGETKQAEVVAWGMRAALEEEAAACTIFAWSDSWWNQETVIEDWAFGLSRASGEAKQALAVVEALGDPPLADGPDISVIVCTRNGRDRIGGALRALQRSRGKGYEVIVVDDGSTDGTAEFLASEFPWVHLLRLPSGGLSRARNAGAAMAKGEILAFTDDDCEPDEEWLDRLRKGFADAEFAAVGGPNLAPTPRSIEEAVVCASPGAPSHVMLTDVEAEHLPGCNLAVRKAVFEEIGGFDQRFHTAGDDVDFCWRLQDAGHRLGFVPGAFVWHWRRPSIWAFLRQQRGYGRAERLLMAKHPQRFSASGEARWQGFVYGGGPVRTVNGSIIYFGEMGTAGYQSLVTRTLPLRELDRRFATFRARCLLALVKCLQPMVRRWERNRRLRLPWPQSVTNQWEPPDFELSQACGRAPREVLLRVVLDHGWEPADATSVHDLEKGEARLLLALEHGPQGLGHLLLRGWHCSPEDLHPELTGLSLACSETPKR